MQRPPKDSSPSQLAPALFLPLPLVAGAADPLEVDLGKSDRLIWAILAVEPVSQVLPPRGDNPRPNLLNLCFHALFVVNFVLVMYLRLGGG